MAQITIAVEETIDAYATWTHVFQGANTTWLGFDTRQILGNFFIGLQGQTMNFWNAQIPPGSTIVSATMEVTASQNSGAATYTSQMTAQKRSTDNYGLLPMQLPFDGFVGWRRDFWGNMDVDLNDAGGLGIIETSGGVNNSGWVVKQLTISPNTVPMRERLGQIFTMPASASNVIGSATLQMVRRGNPAGSGRILVQGVSLNRGVQEPDGVTIATSDAVLQSTIPTAPATGSPVLFAFTGADQVALTVGTDYALIYDSDNTIVNNVDNVLIRQQNAFLSTGRQVHYGGGVGNDWQNYPGTVDANLWHTDGLNFVTADIPWIMPRFFNGVTYTSPDISVLIQAQIDDPGYGQNAGVMVAMNRGAPSNFNRVWRSNTHAPGPGPVLRVTYDEPIVILTPGGGIDDAYIKRKKRLKRESEDIQMLMFMISVIEQDRKP